MPGSSLWLTPPIGELDTNIQIIIAADVPSFFLPDQSIYFIPHITLTSFIPSSVILPDPNDPTEAENWLQNLDLPNLDKVKIHGDRSKIGDVYFQKLTMPCEKNDALRDLARACRVQATDDTASQAEAWAKESYYPHMSLMYSDRSPQDVSAKLDEIKTEMRERQNKYPSSRRATGGQIVLVPTDLEVDQWQPVAARDLPDLEWEWEV